MKSCFFEKLNKMDEILPQLTKGEKMIEFAKITKERGDLTTNFRNIK